MRGIFPETKRSWSDGLPSFNQDYRNPYEIYFGLFGGEDDSGGGGGLSDEDIDQDLQQDIAAAGAGGYGSLSGQTNVGYSDGFDPSDSDTATAIAASKAISDAAAGGQAAVDFAQDAAAQSPAVQQAVANLTGVPVGSATPVQDIFTADTGMVTDATPVPMTIDEQIASQINRNKSALGNLSPSEQARRDEIAFMNRQSVNQAGIGTLGTASTYADVLNNPMRQDERTMNPAEFEAQYGFPPRGITGITASPQVNAQAVLGGPSIGVMTPSDGLNTDDMSRVNISTPSSNQNNLVDIGAAGLGVDVPTSTTTPAQNTLGMEDEYLDEDIAAGFGQYVGGPGGGPGSSGLSTFASRQKRANDYAKEMGYDLTDQSTMKRGAERGFSGITDEQRADLEKRAAESIFGDSFLNNPRKINDILSNVDKNNNLTRATGIYTNPDGTVRGVTSLPDPDGLMQSGVNLLGGFIPDFIGETYTGTGANPFNRGEDPGGSGGDGPDQPVKAANDPCPAGYQMVNGACQISGDIIDLAEDGPGSGFVINPNTGLPTLFQPTTQATQVGPINPFVLQPYPRPPVGINPPGSAAASGIQALSPTGAALGRSI